MVTSLKADALMTAERREDKFLVAVAQARTLAALLDRRLDSHRHRGEGANTLPAAHHYVTTIYFDTAGRSLYRAATAHAGNHVKLRAKEYYDLHTDLAETATDARQLVRYQPVLWLELKHKDRSFTGKQRIGIPKQDVPAFFAAGRITPAMVDIQTEAYGSDARAVLDAVADLCARCEEPLRADCLVNYRRTAWQDEAGELRVTIDTALAYYRPPDDLWTRTWALVRPTLGPALLIEPRRVLEVKSRAALPDWLVDALAANHIHPAPFSKFEAASAAIHG